MVFLNVIKIIFKKFYFFIILISYIISLLNLLFIPYTPKLYYCYLVDTTVSGVVLKTFKEERPKKLRIVLF